ncbi:hypothetical protein CRM22_006396 [Opisthorchis felineus]|uniref:Uncharacterized protein n=1 Tax=Opisthorchis felineus TaxID=147828 RepID=A0A4S2LL84_OPIFE|nr:hypothetical protein CRM22_006396 [Opisthorchis felineus]TGZ64413.1 hypothetical protein CRM22_006396 [Opisthorchis felineus]
MSRLRLFNFQAFVICFFVLEATSALAVEQDAYTKCTDQCGMNPGSVPTEQKDFDCVDKCLGGIKLYCEDPESTAPNDPEWRKMCSTFYIPAVI